MIKLKLNKNGFIATSLIYSFFLIFISLFIAVIADYLQNKVLLEATEKGIKDELNAFVDINTFKVGDIISFEGTASNACDELGENSLNMWIVAAIDLSSEKIVLYSYELSNSPDNPLSLSNVTNDIELVGNLNNSVMNKVLYTYASSTSESFRLFSGEWVTVDETQCSSIESGYENYKTDKGCLRGTTPSTTYYRDRKEKTISGNINECANNVDDISGTIYLNADL